MLNNSYLCVDQPNLSPEKIRIAPAIMDYQNYIDPKNICQKSRELIKAAIVENLLSDPYKMTYQKPPPRES